jgi:hypothetical protein
MDCSTGTDSISDSTLDHLALGIGLELDHLSLDLERSLGDQDRRTQKTRKTSAQQRQEAAAV